MTKKIVIVMALVCLSVALYSIPVGLNIMPTATNMESTVMAQYITNDAPQIYANEGSTIFGMQYANVLGFEGGIDEVSKGVGTVYNLKMSFADNGDDWGFAIGAQGIGEKSKTEYYAVAAAYEITEKWPLSLHAGIITNTEDTYGIMLGAEMNLSKNYYVQADYVNGSRKDGSAVSINYKEKNIEVGITQYMPKVGKDKTVFMLTLYTN